MPIEFDYRIIEEAGTWHCYNIKQMGSWWVALGSENNIWVSRDSMETWNKVDVAAILASGWTVGQFSLIDWNRDEANPVFMLGGYSSNNSLLRTTNFETFTLVTPGSGSGLRDITFIGWGWVVCYAYANARCSYDGLTWVNGPANEDWGGWSTTDLGDGYFAYGGLGRVLRNSSPYVFNTSVTQLYSTGYTDYVHSMLKGSDNKVHAFSFTRGSSRALHYTRNASILSSTRQVQLTIQPGQTGVPFYYVAALALLEGPPGEFICGAYDVPGNVFKLYKSTNYGGAWGIDQVLPVTECIYRGYYDNTYILGRRANAAGSGYCTTEAKTISGVVVDRYGNPCSRKVRLYNRENGHLLQDIQSDAVTGVYRFNIGSRLPTEYAAVCFADDTAEGKIFNDQIYRVIPN
jgi:hypothetical protein